jgi:hypothetical protein
MLEGLRRDRDAGVRAAAYRWLAVDPADEVADLLEEGLRDADGLVRATALDALAGRPEREPSLAALLRDADPRVRLCALESSVARVTPQRDRGAAVVAVTRGLDDAVWSVRLRAAELAGGLPDALLLSPLIRALEDERLRIRMAAHVALVSLTGIPFEPEPAPWRAWLEEDGRSFDPSRREWPDRPPAAGGGTVEAGRFLDVPIASRHVAFVLDASGSMARRMGDGRTRWQHVAEALGTSLHGLRDAAVNVYRFSDEVEAIFPRPLRLTATIRSRIARWLDETVPGGRTALFDGVAAALDEPEVDTIVLLSDGAPSAGTFFTKTDLVSEVARRNRWRRARIDVIDVGGDAVAKRWQGALGRLAKESGGRYVRRQARGPAQK